MCAMRTLFTSNAQPNAKQESKSTQDGCGDDVNVSLANYHLYHWLFCSSFTHSNPSHIATY